MELRVFAEMAAAEIQNRLGEKYTISVITNLKNNSLILTGILFAKEGGSVSPTIYLNDLYSAYCGNRMEFNDIVDELIARYQKSLGSVQELCTFDLEFDNCRSRIVYRLISRERNKELLKQVPYIPFLDLAITFHLVISISDSCVQSLRIQNNLQQRWNLSTEQLFCCARDNTEKMMPPEVMMLSDLIGRYIPVSREHLTNEGKADMIVVTNKTGVNGASAVLYDGLIEKLSKAYDSDLYLIPSSIHEMIVIPADDPDHKMHEILECMVRDINEKIVEDGDILSDRVYQYKKIEKKFI